MHKFSVKLIFVALIIFGSINSRSEEKDCTELRGCIQKDINNLISGAKSGTQEEYLKKLTDLQKNFETTYLSKKEGYSDDAELKYATSLFELLTAPGNDFIKMQNSFKAKGCLATITRMRDNTRSFFKDATSSQPKYHYDLEAWRSFNQLINKICEIK